MTIHRSGSRSSRSSTTVVIDHIEYDSDLTGLAGRDHIRRRFFFDFIDEIDLVLLLWFLILVLVILRPQLDTLEKENSEQSFNSFLSSLYLSS
jgi:hypothetical protein